MKNLAMFPNCIHNNNLQCTVKIVLSNQLFQPEITLTHHTEILIATIVKLLSLEVMNEWKNDERIREWILL